MNFGRLNERVIVQQSTDAANSLGETIQTWATFATVWASVDGVSSQEALRAGQVGVAISHNLQMRYLTGLTAQMRILWGSRILEITSVLEADSKTVHNLVCQEAAT